MKFGIKSAREQASSADTIRLKPFLHDAQQAAVLDERGNILGMAYRSIVSGPRSKHAVWMYSVSRHSTSTTRGMVPEAEVEFVK